MIRMLGLAAVLVGVATFSALGAGARDWVVVQSSGEVYVQSSGVQLVSLSRGPTTLAPGSVLLTAPTGRVMLVRGAQTMIVSPNSIVAGPRGPTNQPTTILERSGEVEFDVDKQNVQHFSVETPYLAAV